jgi:hypothetical protein
MRTRARFAQLTAVVLVVGGLLVLGPAASAGSCPDYAPPVESGVIRDSRINEVSGLVAGRTAPRMLWMHEDSGNGTWLFAIDPEGDVLASIEVLNATNRDWEDMARSKGRLWIGDVGDNAEARPEIQVYWFDEPSSLGVDSVRASMVTLRYPDGSHNSEAIVVHRQRIFVFEKRRPDPVSRVYGASLRGVQPGDTLELRLVAHVPMPNVTSADVGPDGVVVRNYLSVNVFPWAGRGGVARTLRRADPCQVDEMPSSEAVAFSRSGHRVYSIPEGSDPEITYAARR